MSIFQLNEILLYMCFKQYAGNFLQARQAALQARQAALQTLYKKSINLHLLRLLAHLLEKSSKEFTYLFLEARKAHLYADQHKFSIKVDFISKLWQYYSYRVFPF